MKKNPTYFLTIIVLSGIILVSNSCADQGMSIIDNQENPVKPIDSKNIIGDFQNASYFTKTIGSPIDIEKAKRWIKNYEHVHGRGFEYYIKSEALKGILANANCNGISLRYGLDSRNLMHIIPVGVDNMGQEIKADKVTTILGDINWEQSKELTNSYWGIVRSHYFGANTFERLFRNQDCKVVKVTAALDDNSNPQLLLTNAGIGEDKTVEDESFPCPPHCETMND